MTSRVQGPLPNTTQTRKWTKDAEAQKHPVLTYCGLIIHYSEILWEISECNMVSVDQYATALILSQAAGN